MVQLISQTVKPVLYRGAIFKSLPETRGSIYVELPVCGTPTQCKNYGGLSRIPLLPDYPIGLSYVLRTNYKYGIIHMG